MKPTNILLLLSFLAAIPCPAQPMLPANPLPAPSHTDWAFFSQQFNASQRPMDQPTGESISAARLRHKPSGKAWKAFGRGLKFDQRGAITSAATEFQRAVTVDPEYSEAHGNLGVEDTMLGLFDEAASEFRRAIALDPATAIHHSNFAYVLIRLRRHTEAESEAQTAVSLDAGNAKAQFLLGYLLALRPETRDRAVPHLEYASRELPQAHRVLVEVGRLQSGTSSAPNQKTSER